MYELACLCFIRIARLLNSSSMSKRPRLLQRGSTSPSLSLAARTAFSPQISQDPPYVIDVLSFSQVYAAAGSDSSIKLYDKSSLQCLTSVGSSGTLKSIAKTSGGEEALIATYENGAVEIFDLRSGATSSQIKLKGMSYSALLLLGISS